MVARKRQTQVESFSTNILNKKKKKQGDKAKNQTVQIGSIRISSEGVNGDVCVKPDFVDGHICYKLRNSLGGYGGIRVVRVSDDLGRW